MTDLSSIRCKSVYRILVSPDEIDSIRTATEMDVTVPRCDGSRIDIGDIVHLWVAGQTAIGRVGVSMLGKGMVVGKAMGSVIIVRLDIVLPVPIPLEVLQPYYNQISEYLHGHLLDDSDARVEQLALEAVHAVLSDK